MNKEAQILKNILKDKKYEKELSKLEKELMFWESEAELFEKTSYIIPKEDVPKVNIHISNQIRLRKAQIGLLKKNKEDGKADG